MSALTPRTVSDAGGRCRFRLPRAAFELDATLVFPAPGITGLLGASGSGKTSLLRCIAGLEAGARGSIEVAGDTWQDDERGIFLPPQARRVGLVFQEPRLFPHLGVAGNLDYGRRRSRHSAAVDRGQVIEWLQLGPLLTRHTSALSGGERQRVAIGRALLANPRLLLLDEPLSATDAAHRDEILPFLDRLHAHLAMPMIYVSHQLDELLRVCDRLAVMSDGRVLACDTPDEVLARADLPGLDGEAAGRLLTGRVAGYDAGYDESQVQIGAHCLSIPGRHGAKGDRLRLRVLARDVSLALARPGASSVRNIVPVRVTAVVAGSDAFAMVHLETGSLRLTARVTRRSAERLGLHSGQNVYAQIKAAAVRGAVPVPARIS